MKKLLDLGAGNMPYGEKGYLTIALDVYDFDSEPDENIEFMNHDMLKGLPFNDNSIDKVYSHHVLEHLPHQLPDGKDALVFVVDEIGRVLKPKCEAHLIVPWNEHTNAWRHPAHYRFFNKDLFAWFDSKNPTPDHEAYGYTHKMKMTRNEIVDECHIYAIFVK